MEMNRLRVVVGIALIVTIVGAVFTTIAITEQRYMDSTTPEERAQHAETAREIQSLQIGEFIEMNDGTVYLVLWSEEDSNVIRVISSIFEINENSSDSRMAVRLLSRNVKRLVRSGDPDIDQYWSHFRPRPEDG